MSQEQADLLQGPQLDSGELPSQDPLALYQGQLSEALRKMLPATLEPAPLEAPPVMLNFRPYNTLPDRGARLQGRRWTLSLFEVAPDAMRQALRYASQSLGRGPLLIEAIACLSALHQQGLPLKGQLGTWTKDVWTVATSKTQFTNISVWYCWDRLKTAVNRRSGDGPMTVMNTPQSVLNAMRDQRYLCIRATCRLALENSAYLASDMTITGLVSEEGSFMPVEI